MDSCILRVAIPSPLRRFFDYLPPAAQPDVAVGCRVWVPFGRTRQVGVVAAVADRSELPPERLRRVEAVIDPTPVLPPSVTALLYWAAGYYHHPPGEVWQAALPVALRRGEVLRPPRITRWQLSEAGRAVDPATLARAPRQAALLARLAAFPDGAGSDELAGEGDWRGALRTLCDKGWVVPIEGAAVVATAAQPGHPLNPEQQRAVDAIGAGLGGFAAFLLEGITGSGKTEVYLHVVERVLAAGHQVLVLVPEIGLTPQLVARFRRLGAPLALLHSDLASGERLAAWQAAADGSARIVIGTRSAVFTPLPRLGLVIIDEEHDASLKQQEGFRYSARDVAVWRARQCAVPVVLGSATPSLESLANAEAGRYHLLHLPQRAGGASSPTLRVVDMRGLSVREPLAPALETTMREHLQAGGQVLLFLNRRGFAPVQMCGGCGWVGECRRCDARLTLHRREHRLRCHHCGAEQRVPEQCPTCGSSELVLLGHGTERIEALLQERFADHVILRIDRDSTRRRGALEGLLAQAQAGHGEILLGTQMVAKGHHFPGVTLVAVLDADQGLFSADFRAPERLAQLIVQVAGRAGRAERPGEVVIQSRQPAHPFWSRLLEGGYRRVAADELAERRAACWPPASLLALLRAEATGQAAPLAFLEQAARLARQIGHDGVDLMGPLPAPMERRAGRYRAQLLLQATRRSDLHRLLAALAPALEGLAEGRRVRWSLDVDPLELF